MRRTLILLVALLTFGSSNNISIEKQIDTIFKEFENTSSPGASVTVLKDDKLIYQKGFGMADIGENILIEPKTNFRLASITKQFTALSILLLENEGKLLLTDKMAKYFPELKQSYSNITIKNILQHTSGILDYESLANRQDTIQLRDKDVLKLLSEKDSLFFEPGTKHQYSNSGYAFLALLVERLSGVSFAEFLNKKIFIPLQMNNTVAYEKGISNVTNRAYGYTKADTGFVNSDQSLFSAVLGDGGIYSSTIDLIKWDKEVNSPTLLPKEKFAKSFSKGKTSSEQEFNYGFGWRLDPYKNNERFYHTGGTSGFSNIYMKLPEHQLTIIVLINIYDYDAKGYAEKVADVLIK
ncbi:MAG: beta-lactamase family protein [Melioribacteraceae bacterium]|nr:beta-lactamase family protein [Melioribacteraceae bacterium]